MSRSASLLRRLDLVLGGLFLASWALVILRRVGWSLVQPGSVTLDLYRLYGLSGMLGWAGGNLFVWRSRHLPSPVRPALALFYYIGPIGLIFLARALGDPAALAGAPLAPLFAVGVFSVFFLVPVVLRPPKRR